MNAILMSIQPKWIEKIISGEKIIEVRKTAPKETPFKVYVYCTKSGKQLNMPVDLQKDLDETGSWDCINSPIGNGKIVAEFVCEKAEMVDLEFVDNKLLELSGLSKKELSDYVTNNSKKDFFSAPFALHLSALKVYDKPKELGEFKHLPCSKPEKACDNCKHKHNVGSYEYPEHECGRDEPYAVTHAPQNFIYVEEL